MMSKPLPLDSVSLYSKDDCPWCDKARELLESKGIMIEWERKVGRDLTPAQFKAIANDYSWNPPTVPMIFFKTKENTWSLLGGYNELETRLSNNA